MEGGFWMTGSPGSSGKTLTWAVKSTTHAQQEIKLSTFVQQCKSAGQIYNEETPDMYITISAILYLLYSIIPCVYIYSF